jgi:hypothetical protein
MDAARAKITARQWNQCGGGSFLDIYIRKGVVNEPHRRALLGYIRHEQIWLIGQMQAQEGVRREHPGIPLDQVLGRRNYVYVVRDAEDLTNWFEVIESTALAKVSLTSEEQDTITSQEPAYAMYIKKGIRCRPNDTPEIKRAVMVMTGEMEEGENEGVNQ